MSPLLSSLLVSLSELAEEEEVNHLLSYGIGALALGLLVALMTALMVFGGGRDHS